MKKNIHPNYYPKTKAKCTCGAEFEIGSTLESIKVEICSQCHPFYSGKDTIVDTAGRVERFKQRQAVAKKITPKKVIIKKVKK